MLPKTNHMSGSIFYVQSMEVTGVFSNPQFTDDFVRKMLILCFL